MIGDRCDARAEIVEHRPDAAVRPFVGHVGEQADQPEAEDETDGPAAIGRRKPCSLTRLIY